MNYKNIFYSTGVTNVGLIGTGAFGQSFLAQSRWIPQIRVPVVCDRDVAIAEEACLQTGLLPGDLKVCYTEADANDTMASGRTAVISDAALLIDLPVDVVMEASGIPEAGTYHALSAIENGKHVVMVTKETDCVVGPVLTRLAQNAGLVYTPPDGDQPSLLIGLISWAETLGFEIVCAGKAAELDFVFDPNSNRMTRGSQTATITEGNLWQLSAGAAEQGISLRRRVLESMPQFSVADLCEMAVILNGTDFDYDAPRLHAPIARIIEMPEIMCRRDDGGIFNREGIVDMVNCLRRPDEISFGGGVFIVLKCRAKKTWQFLKNKGHLISRDGTRAMIFRPYHLLGVETATSVLMADFLNQSTGSTAPKPRVDVGARTSRTLEQGYRLTLEHDHSITGVMPELLPAKTMASDSPVPYYMAAGNRLKCTVEKGDLLTYGMIDHNPKSCLWKLRREQDSLFGMTDCK